MRSLTHLDRHAALSQADSFEVIQASSVAHCFEDIVDVLIVFEAYVSSTDLCAVQFPPAVLVII